MLGAEVHNLMVGMRGEGGCGKRRGGMGEEEGRDVGMREGRDCNKVVSPKSEHCHKNNGLQSL